MSLTVGDRLGPYEITGTLGAGGMGEVFRARDTRLGRDVALKVLPDSLIADAERVARLTREAQLLAALNHPNIAQIFAFENGAISLELVEGATLAERLSAGPLDVDEAVAIARQIVDALDAAHAQGIIHRDLKPANIKVRADGTVKVLDFGLAKIVDTSSASSVLQSLSPTITSPVMATGAGVILGTAAYMAPEQARGRAVDRRADVWAFGCVLFEMLTGRRAFDDEDVSLTMSRILQREPELEILPANVGPHIRQLLSLCLRKDVRRRLADMQDVRLFLQNDLESPAPPIAASSPVRRRGLAAVAALGLLVAAAATAWWLKPAPPAGSGDVIRFAVTPPEGSQFPGANFAPRMAVSPDGRYLAITVSQAGKPDQLWVRRLETLELMPLTNLSTDAAAGGEPVQQPFWSPDSRFVAFFSDGALRKVGLDDRVVQTICKVPGNQYGGAWASDGTILFGSSATKGLMRVSAGGGVPVQVTRVAAGENAHLWPRWLPDGRHYLYWSGTNAAGEAAVFAGEVDGGTPRRLFASATMAEFAPPDLLLYVRDETLLARHIDPVSLTFTSDPVAVASSVQVTASGRLGMSVSAGGVLAYKPGTEGLSADGQLGWVERNGKGAAAAGLPGVLRGVDMTPDGRLAIVHRDEASGGDLWAVDFARGSQTRLTFDRDMHSAAPVLMPGGRRMLFLKIGERAIYEKDVTGVGTERLVYKSPGPMVVPWAVTPDGKTLVVTVGDTNADLDLATLPVAGGMPSPMMSRPGTQGQAQFSPDGHWLAYTSSESGAPEVFVENYPAGDTRYQVSTSSGRLPRWRGDSRELFFSTGRGVITVMSVSVEPQGNALRIGVPASLFDVPWPNPGHTVPFVPWAVTADGSRFLVTRLPEQAAAAPPAGVIVVVNWTRELQNR
jgi:Tol biopolymer transport system component/tRNA A-37 threonylcarbamoyl transferase component Bud32